MYIMNLIHEICLTKIAIDKTQKWKFINHAKQVKKYNNLISQFLDLDIFNASENMITFLLSLESEIINNIKINATYTNRYLNININKDPNIIITFLPESNRFEVKTNDLSFTIYRNNKICSKISKIWEPLTDDIKNNYIDIITLVAEYISKS